MTKPKTQNLLLYFYFVCYCITMNVNWVNNIPIPALPIIPPRKNPTLVGVIKLEKNPKNAEPFSNVNLPNVSKMPTGPTIPEKDDPYEITKIKDFVSEQDYNPINRFMDWNKKHPQGQDAPMRSENKMISHARKYNSY